MLLSGVHIATLASPRAYSFAQVDEVCTVVAALNRGPFVLCAAPAKCPRCFDEPETFCTDCGAVAEDGT